MIYGFVKQSNGHIKVYSEVGQGTTMKLYLPKTAAEADAVEPQVTVESRPPNGESILVVEDDAMVRDFVVRQLDRLGYRALAAAKGAEALALIDRGDHIDLMLTDVMLAGGMSGKQLAFEADLRRPGLKVLYMSGYAENAILHHGRLDPDVALLSKPFRAADLERAIREAIGEKGA
jgi:CheY-like chemotaxis protein